MRPVLAVVPARGGSRGIERKNLQRIDGKTLVALAADVALRTGGIDVAVLSTDDPEIASEGLNHGLSVFFIRPQYLATDEADSFAVWRHALLATEAELGVTFGGSVLLEPTSPMRTPGDVQGALEILIARSAGCVLTLSRTPAHFSPHKSFVLREDSRVDYLTSDGARFARRQSVPRLYHRNGLCYAATREWLMTASDLVGNTTIAMITERPVVNIDDPFDMELAQWLMTRDRDTETSD
ncbi:MAG TPA: acylneuraminate cytidylyltransferase family protein [Actinomycetota bacterium]|nr:acylneuraminate cytidylyltransferase family protein [Actinomycetota bacterium]